MPNNDRVPALGFLAFLLSMLSMATIGLVVPLGGEFGAALGLTKSQFGAALSLFSIPSAVFSLTLGSACDRFGARRMFLSGTVIAVIADLLLARASSAMMFRAEVFLAGVGFAAIIVSSPALVIAHLEGPARTRALSLWSTYAPVGVAAGLILAAPFVGKTDWQAALYIHAALLACSAAGAAWALRKVRFVQIAPRRSSLTDILAVMRQVVVVRLALAVAVPSALSYGTSLLAPSYITTATHVSMASAALLVAAAKMAVALAGGLFTGWLISRQADAKRLFAMLVGIGIIGQLMLFYPDSGLVVSLAGLGIWLFCYAGISALVFTVLPSVFPRREDMGAANGLMSQTVSCFSFLAPIIYFLDLPWSFFPVLAAVGMLVSLAVMPGKRADARR